ncbi:hypothetical protein [Acinetobacter sp. TAC-1]|uniref:hypothetical protein n=2 Tax=unclassified Acinetobacter TaxID=196816 RepID=UPI0023AB4F6C|nr:hypothetical protein [Acinetobacter sp. TAC-1]WEE38619.1 hypothetical protein PYV58_17030 [Acinetobacter sp. TAC-1]
MINIEEERKAFEIEWIKLGGDFKSFSIIDNMYVLIPSMASADDVIKELAERAVNSAFALWLIQSRQKQVVIDDLNIQLKDAKATPEGFVLVPKENISCYWQDNDEPENFCSNESDFDCLGDCIDLGEIMEINKFTQAHVNKEILFGTWFAEAIDPSEKANFFVGTHAECLEIVAKNKAVIEAQEQSHDSQNT